jgi:phage gp46-like protein
VAWVLQDYRRDKMPDIKLSINPVIGNFDWSFADGDIVYARDIETAVVLSLFTDARASNDFIPPDGSGDRRGFWGDYYDVSPTGSLLWTLRRAIISDTTTLLNLAKTYALQSLKWLKVAGIVDQIIVETSWLNREALAISVTVTEPNSNQTNTYVWAWSLSATNIIPKPITNNVISITPGGILGVNFILDQSLLGSSTGSLLDDNFLLNESPLV